MTLSPVVEAPDCGHSDAQEPRPPHSTFRPTLPTPATTPVRARTPVEDESETEPPILGNDSNAPRSSGAGIPDFRSHAFDTQRKFAATLFLTPIDRFHQVGSTYLHPQTVDPKVSNRRRIEEVAQEAPLSSCYLVKATREQHRQVGKNHRRFLVRKIQSIEAAQQFLRARIVKVSVQNVLLIPVSPPTIVQTTMQMDRITLRVH